MEGLEISGMERSKTGGGSTGFDFYGEDDTVSELDICAGDEMDLEQDYFEKLRIQRERMQKLEKCYVQKQQQLTKQVNRANQLISEIQRLTTFIPYKEKFEQLRLAHQQLLTKYNVQQSQLQIIKHELSQEIDQRDKTIFRLKSQLKSWKDSSTVNANQLEQAKSDKQQQIRKLKRQWKDKQNRLIEEIDTLRTNNNKIKQQLENEAHFNDRQKQKLIYQIKSRESNILDLEKALEQARKGNLQMKNEFIKFKQQFNGRERQLSSMCAKLKYQISQNKRSIGDKDAKIDQLQSQLKKSQTNVQQSKKQIENIKAEYKKSCQFYENGNKRLKHESDSEIGRLQSFVNELKTSIQQLMEVKNHLLLQNGKLMAILKKKEHTQRQRKQLLRTQFKEIDKIEKVIDRLQ